MTKTLISFIGTGRLTQNGTAKREYETAKYSFQNKEIESSFIASVLADELFVDNIYLLGTTKSMWEEVYRYYCEKNNMSFDEDYYYKLGEITEKASSKTKTDVIDVSKLEASIGQGSKVVILPYGMDENELWQMFSHLEKLMQEAIDGTAFYLDITHSFRSMPIFSMTSLLYIQDVLGHDIKLDGIYYGMFEVKSEYNGITPIIDLSLIIEIQNWIKAAHSFLNYGKGYLLAELLDDEKDAKLITKFSDAMSLNYLDEVDQSLTNLKKLADKDEQGIAKHILPDVMNKLVGRMYKAKSKSHAHFQLELSTWHFENKNYAQAYLVFVEAIVTFTCEVNNWKWNGFDNREKAKKKLRNEKTVISELFKESNKIRNKIAHDIRKGGDGSTTVIKKLKEFIKSLNTTLNKT